MNSREENIELLNKIEAGLKLAIHKLYVQMAANNETAVVSIDGEIRRIPAKELLEKHDA